MKNYEFLEHTADIGIRLKAKGLNELFKNAAMAMFEIAAERKFEIRNSKFEKIIIKQKAENLEELFINWLNELLSLSSAKELIFTDFKINKLSETALEATAIGENIADYKVNTEIKAATYHELKIEKIDSEWQVQVIFDV
ncbi:MAG: archease [Candidatus Omnitrophota bacterium]